MPKDYEYKLDFKLLLAATGVFFILLIIAGLVATPNFENPQVLTIEGKLVKNSNLKLEVGETYFYDFKIGNESANLTYFIYQGPNCTGIRSNEIRNLSSLCLKKDGTELNHSSNYSFENPSIFLFKPWMLAVDNEWKWNISEYLKYNETIQKFREVKLESKGLKNYSGFEVYEIWEYQENSTPTITYVDKEKRIARYLKTGDFEITLRNYTKIR